MLTGLVDKSIVQRADRGGQVRYRMLDTLREYGSELLAARGDQDALRHRAFDWYAGRLARARTELATAAQVHWLEWFGRERDNIRAVLAHVLSTADAEDVREAMGTLGRLWALNGCVGEGRLWMDRMLETCGTSGTGWSDTLSTAALMMTLQGDLTAAGALLDRVLAQARAEGCDTGIAYALSGQAVAALFAGDHDRTLELLGAADELSRESGDADVLFLLIEVFRALAHMFEGDHAAAVAHAERAVRAGEERGEMWARSYGMLISGLSLWLSDDLDASLDRLRRCLRIKRDLDDGLGVAQGLEAVAACLSSRGEVVRAARLLGAGDRMRELTQAAWFGPQHELLRQIHVEKAKASIGEERFRAAFNEGERLPLATAIEDALGELPAAPAVPGSDDPVRSPATLTERELQVAELVAEGLSNRDIAERLTIAKRTADSHVEHILAKLGYSSRTQIAVWFTARET